MTTPELKAKWEKRKAEGDDIFTSAGISDVVGCLLRLEDSLSCVDRPTRDTVLPFVKHCVLELNAVNEKHEIIDTLEREELCEVIIAAVVSKGVLLAPAEDITYEWRDW